jgi:hypothetical protein
LPALGGNIRKGAGENKSKRGKKGSSRRAAKFRTKGRAVGNTNSRTSNNPKSNSNKHKACNLTFEQTIEIMNSRCPQKKITSEEFNGPEYQHIRSRLDDVYESQQLDSEDEAVSQTVALTKVPLYGNLQPSQKQEDSIRLLSANINSVSYWRSGNVKVQRLRYLIGQYSLDCIGCQEVCINWAKHRPSETLAALIRDGNTELRSVDSYNRHEGDNESNRQRGGTSTILIEQLQTYVIDKGTDHTDLGRWS